MAREKSPAFQWYPKDFLADGPCVAMSCAEAGAYVRLLSFCWLEHSLPADDRQLARMAGATPREWESVKAAVLARFEMGEDGRLRHGRLDAEREIQAEWRSVSSAGGRASVESRRRSRGSANPRTNCEPHREPHREPSGSQPVHNAREPQREVIVNSPSPSPSPSSEVHTHTAREAPLSARSEHRGHALCGRVCLPAFLFREFVQGCGGDNSTAHAYVDTWALALIQAIADGGTRAAEVIGDPVKWWRFQWEAGHRTSKPDTRQAEQDRVLAEVMAMGPAPRRTA